MGGNIFRGSSCLLILLIVSGCSNNYDTIIRGGTVYDGTGREPVVTDVGISGDTIAFIGDLSDKTAKKEIDAKGVAVSPGFINMLSWATESLLIDGKSQSDIRQGVTLEVMGEGTSMGPLNNVMKASAARDAKRSKQGFTIEWTSLDEYLSLLEKKGVSTNVASFIGAATVREYVLGLNDRAPNAAELEKMKLLVKQAMEDGAMGVGSSLIYAPGSYASTEELISLCKVAGEYNGMYITHMRSEGNNVLNAVKETIRIAREGKLRAEIYHLKLAGRANHSKLDSVLSIMDRANSDGLHITADMYTYEAGASGLDASMPPWLQEGGVNEWIRRMKDPAIRKKALAEMSQSNAGWENLMRLSGGADGVLLVDFRNDSLKKFTGKSLAEVAKLINKSPEETAMDLVAADSTRIGVVYFMMDPGNVKRQLALPFVSIGSDASSIAPEGTFVKSSVHPRAYGCFARLFAKYVRDEKILSVSEAVRRLTSLPASNLRLAKRGKLAVGYFADIVVFDPATIQDHATYEKPHQYSTGVSDVFVNGIQVLANGEHTGAKPGKVVRGPGWRNRTAK